MSNVISLRLRHMNDHKLAQEILSHASLMARGLSYAENETDPRRARMWMEATETKEDLFLEEVEEARRRLAAAPKDWGGLERWLLLVGSWELVAS